MNNQFNDSQHDKVNDAAGEIELDQLVLDRLVDNDLSDEEYRNVLRLVEEKPDGWRKLAISFLESQAFEKEMTTFHLNSEKSIQEANQRGLDSAMPVERSAGLQPPKSGTKNHKTAKEKSCVHPENKDQFETGSIWMSRMRSAVPAIAACIAIAFIASLYVREIQNRSQRATLGARKGGQNSLDNSTIDPEYIELVSNDRSNSVKAPIYDHKGFDPATFANEIDHLKPSIQQAVNRPGWQADERTHMMPIRDKTGNKIILPLKEIKLTPSSFEGYQ